MSGTWLWINWTTMTSHGVRLTCVEYVAVLLTLLSTELTQVITGETACDDDRVTIPCPLPCYCRAPDYRSVRCDAGGLTSIPASVWTVIPTSLNLSSNSIVEWTDIDITSADDSHIACLSTLILSHSSVTRVRPRAFERLRALRQLSLDHNHISMLQSTTFVGLRRLELLDISHNELVDLPQSLFDEVNQLKVLRLAANRLSSVPVTALRSLTQLRTLDLSDNPLTAIHRDLLASAKQLVNLNVSGTQLTGLLSGTVLPASDTLSVIDMSRCRQLTAAPDAADIAALARLQRLVLPAHTCRCDVSNYRSIVQDMRSRQRPRPPLFCGVTAAPVDVDAICSDTWSPSSRVEPTAKKPLPVPPDVRSDDPLPYDPKLGWYTAAVLSGLLFTFIACVGLDRAQKRLLEACMSRNNKKKQLDYLGEQRQSTYQDQQQQGHPEVRTSTSVCTVADFEVGVDSYRDVET